ncbi:MAG TPA: ABC transporter ATP-binding protein, partial [Myxococcaceae bacterium]|nr:ABC transporter ATP-binding protein [Myxococcaceae bacterium]
TEDGEVTDGSIEFQGERVEHLPPEQIVRRGIFQVMEGRRVFEDLTVEENILMGGYTRRDRGGLKRDRDLCYDYFPALRSRRNALAGYLSGGEQQMLAISRGLMARPKLMLLDEPSLGLAPLIVQEIFRMIERINREEKTTILLVEQNARLALQIASYGYVMEAGRIVLDGESERLRANEDVKEFYLGGAGGERSYRNLKFYKRRKRWLS